MGVQSADPAVTARGRKRQLPWPLNSYLAGFVAGFVLAAGAGLGVISGAGQLSGGLPAIALAGLLAFTAACMVFCRRITRPIVELSARVRQVMTDPSAGPLTVTGPPEVISLARDINTMIETARADAERAARITRQLLIVGRRDTSQPELLGLNAIIADTRELLATVLGAGIEIRVDTVDGLPAIEADRGQVEQLLLYLADNARDAMPQGGTLIIETDIVEFSERMARAHPGARPGRYAECIVSDTGNGMSADIAARIFDPFVTTRPAGQGTGLGLAAVHGIVTRAGGSISVTSEPGTGTTFRILFPAASRRAVRRPSI